MQLPELLLLLILAPVFVVRWLRWLAIVQQKEYRIDRLTSFLRSAEGQSDFFRFIPQLKDFTRTGLKRPARTVRVLVVAIISILVLWYGVLLISTMTLLDPPTVMSFIFFAVFITTLYLLIPLVLLLSCVPTALVSAVVTWKNLYLASAKIKKSHPLIIGVGGSYGKTSTKHLLHHVLSSKFSVFVTPKSHNTKYSVAKSILKGYTDQEVALLEYGAYTRGEIEYLARWFPPSLAVETGFTDQHLSLFGSEENSLKAESELVAALPSTGKVFCNGEDHGAVRICHLGNQDNKLPVIFYSGQDSVVHTTEVQLDKAGHLSFVWKGQRIFMCLVGSHYLPNIQAAIAVAEELGLSEQEIRDALTSFVPNSSFIRSFTLASEAVVLDDGGTSNPKGFEAVIDLAEHIDRPQRILITAGIVDLGTKSNIVHHHLAEQAKRVFHLVMYVGVDGRDEFQKHFGMKMLTEKELIEHTLHKVNDHTLVVIEGKVPKWVERLLVQ